MDNNEHTMETVDFTAWVFGGGSRPVEVAVIGGDGQEGACLDATMRVLRVMDLPIRWRRLRLTAEDCRANKGTVPRDIVQAIRECGLALKAPITRSSVNDGSSTAVDEMLRQELGLIVHRTEIGPVGKSSRLHGQSDFRIELLCERPESVYSPFGRNDRPVFESSDVLAEVARQIVSVAASLPFTATPRVAIVVDRSSPNWTNSSNWNEWKGLLAGEGISALEQISPKAFAIKAMNDPGSLDIVLCSAGFGQIAGHFLGALAGGVELQASVSSGGGVAVFEPFAEKRSDTYPVEAHPTALVRAAVLLLERVGETHAADRLRTALRGLHESGSAFIPVRGRHDSAMEFADALIRRLQGEYELAAPGRGGLAAEC